ncbi:MAG: hypothetical protein IJE97_15015 [Thermoguttaceae bacterium]|nr:hypothetical protein [Thermoguttaceae bacterium]MBQ7109587.1 hypothetical protein [Thermoguttaceae bacterium]
MEKVTYFVNYPTESFSTELRDEANTLSTKARKQPRFAKSLWSSVEVRSKSSLRRSGNG